MQGLGWRSSIPCCKGMHPTEPRFNAHHAQAAHGRRGEQELTLLSSSEQQGCCAVDRAYQGELPSLLGPQENSAHRAAICFIDRRVYGCVAQVTMRSPAAVAPRDMSRVDNQAQVEWDSVSCDSNSSMLHVVVHCLVTSKHPSSMALSRR